MSDIFYYECISPPFFPPPHLCAYVLVSLASVTLCSTSRLAPLYTFVHWGLGYKCSSPQGSTYLQQNLTCYGQLTGLNDYVCFCHTSPWSTPPALSGRHLYGMCPFPGSVHHLFFCEPGRSELLSWGIIWYEPWGGHSRLQLNAVESLYVCNKYM